MHASIWRFNGDTAELLPRYDALVAEIPVANMQLHACLPTADGILVVDACPSEAVFREFFAGPVFRALREAHGLPEPELLDYPVHRAFARGAEL
jgi:hypothetical protein